MNIQSVEAMTMLLDVYITFEGTTTSKSTFVAVISFHRPQSDEHSLWNIDSVYSFFE